MVNYFKPLISIVLVFGTLSISCGDDSDDNASVTASKNGLLIVNATIKDATKFAEYKAAAGTTISDADGEILYAGDDKSVLFGDQDNSLLIVAKFNSKAEIETWYDSDDYQALIENRNEAADMVFTAYDIDAESEEDLSEHLAAVLVQATVKDTDKWAEYGSSAPATFEDDQGIVQFKATNPTVLYGTNDSSLAIILRFMNQNTVNNWYFADDYQDLVATRTEGADVHFTSYNLTAADQRPGAFLVAKVKVLDATKWANNYFAFAPATISAAGGSGQFGGPIAMVDLDADGDATDDGVLNGTNSYDKMVLAYFESKQAIYDWYNSDDYQALIAARDEAANTLFLAYELIADSAVDPDTTNTGILAVDIKIKDAEKFSTYGSAAGPIISNSTNNGKNILKLGNPTVLNDESYEHKNMFVFSFPTSASVKSFYEGTDYQSLVENRNEAADTIFSYYKTSAE